MAVVTVLTAEKTLELVNSSVVSGLINGSGHLILTTYAGLTIDAGYALLGVPDASDITKGVVELATDVETNTGTDATRAVTPFGLASRVAALPVASDTVKGFVELATDAETTTGTDVTRAVTPASLAARVALFFGKLRSIAADAGRLSSPAAGDINWRTDKGDTEIWNGTIWVPGGYNRPYATLTRITTDQSIPDSLSTAVQFNAHSADSHGGHSTSVNNSRFTAPISGIYAIDCSIPFVPGTGIRELNLRVSNTTSYTGQRIVVSSSVTSVLSTSRKIPMTAGQYVEAVVWQNTAAPLAIDRTYSAGPLLDAMWMRPL